jgi:DNA helicase-2/ATP-dependent DNA helicase PcrA
MTVHAAKGLEFDHVFIVGLEQGLFPHERMDEDGMTKEKEEEERRLFYVAITRARKKLWLSHAETRTIYGETRVQGASEYLSDIPKELTEAAYEIQLEAKPRYRMSQGSGLLPDITDLE